MNEFRRQNFNCWLIPSYTVSPVSNNTEADNRVSATKNLLLEVQNLISIIKPDGIFRLIYFSSSTENDLFVQSITNDDVLANSVHTSSNSRLYELRIDYLIEDG